MSTPEVSVIVPAFNATATLPRAIDSVLEQTMRPAQIIVVDDGSSDDPASALARYGSAVTVLRQENRGAAAARNFGARAAAVEFLAFLDADDFWHPRKLELQVPALQKFPQARLCRTLWQTWRAGDPRPSRDIPGGVDLSPRFSDDFEAFFADPYLGTPGVMMRKREFLELGGFREDIRVAEDVDLWLRAAYGRGVVLIPWPLFFVVRTPGSLTSAAGFATFPGNLRVIDDFCKLHPEFPDHSRRAVRKARARVFADWGSGWLAEGNSSKAAPLLARSLLQSFSPRAFYLLSKSLLTYPASGRRRR